MENHISENLNIKVIVLYLERFRRSILNFDEKYWMFVSQKCEGDENFYGFLRTREPSQFLKNLKILGQNTLKEIFSKM